MSSDAFNIRLQVLCMAKEMVIEEFHQKREEIQMNWDLRRQQGSKKGGLYPIHGESVPDISFPRFPNTQDVLEKATSLYSFVTNRG